MLKDHTFHPGEIAVQTKAGEAHRAARNAKLVSDTILAGARPFIEQQQMVVLASVDAQDHVWASLVFGQAGFASVDAANLISLHVAAAGRDVSDPLWANLQVGTAVGMLFIELEIRRRYRVNGQVSLLDSQRIEIEVQEAYPNCPKFIQQRVLQHVGEPRPQQSLATGSSINALIRPLITGADTLFVASLNAEAGADASHRGGHAGFVQIVNDTVLRIPDYAGNSMFNTLGNFALNQSSGICIPDFNGQQLLQLTGKATVLWDQEDPEDMTGGSHRFWQFEIEQWILRPNVQQMQWLDLGPSPFNP